MADPQFDEERRLRMSGQGPGGGGVSGRRIRRSQALTPFGVGAIFDIVGESFVAQDIHRWKGGRPIDAPRIASLMGVGGLKTAPAAPERGDKGPGVPFFRFPQWMFCPAPTCRRRLRWSTRLEGGLEPGRPPRCTVCRARRQLVPMRFVSVCGNGHLDDVDWRRWAHSGASGASRCEVTDRLTFRVLAGRGGGLDSLAVGCEACHSSRTLRGIAAADAFSRMGWRCRGRQPWLPPEHREDCDADPVVVQRGASNVHFPAIASALDIPPESDFDQYGAEIVRVRNNSNFKLLEANPEHPLRDGLIDLVASEEEDVAVDLVRTILASLQDEIPPPRTAAGVDSSEEQILRDEWSAFYREAHQGTPSQGSICRPTHGPRPGVLSCPSGLSRSAPR